MTITIDTFFVSIEGAGEFDGMFGRRIITTDYCMVIIADAGSRNFVLKFLNYGETVDESNYSDWQNTLRKESEMLAAAGLSRGERGPFVPQIYFFAENAQMFYDGQSVFAALCRGCLSSVLRMEYISGTSMNNRDCFFSKAFFSDICFSLKYFNSRNFFHMDLSEKNMIVDHHGHVWLIDFTGAFLCHHRGVLMKDYKPFHLDNDYLTGLNTANLTGHGCEAFQAKMLLDIFSNFFCSCLDRGELDRRICETGVKVLEADDPLSLLEREMSALMIDFDLIFPPFTGWSF